jgi:SRSO17 transposase
MAGILDHPQAQRLLDEATLSTRDVASCAGLLERFLLPYLPLFPRSETRVNARILVEGKLSDLPRKTVEPIAIRAGLPRKPLQHFLSRGAWDHEPLLALLREEVARLWGASHGVLTIDGSGFPKKGTESVGVARQWCGRLGKVDNSQLGVFLGYSCVQGHALLDCRLYLPKEWAQDKLRRKKAGVPQRVVFQESWRIALDLLGRGVGVPHGWITADDEFGRVQEFRSELRRRGERYLVDVPSDTSMRDLEAEVPVQTRRRGSLPKSPFETVAEWATRQPASRWRRVVTRPGEKGMLAVEALTARVQTTWERSRLGPPERLLVRREWGGKMSYHLSNAGEEAGLEQLVRAKGMHHAVEQCFAEGKGEVGLDHYEVRSWTGWHRHMALSMLAVWFLGWERSRLGKGVCG